MSPIVRFPVRLVLFGGLVLALLAALPAKAGMSESGGSTIPEVAAEAGSFETLLTAAKAARLVDTLSGPGPLTVFAPTDEAFAALPAGTVESLLEPENRDKLTAILTYHVVSGKVMAADVAGIDSAPTVNGQTLAVRVDGDAVMINDARVVQADVAASNGVIHVIDKVLLPSE